MKMPKLPNSTHDSPPALPPRRSAPPPPPQPQEEYYSEFDPDPDPQEEYDDFEVQPPQVPNFRPPAEPDDTYEQDNYDEFEGTAPISPYEMGDNPPPPPPPPISRPQIPQPPPPHEDETYEIPEPDEQNASSGSRKSFGSASYSSDGSDAAPPLPSMTNRGKKQPELPSRVEKKPPQVGMVLNDSMLNGIIGGLRKVVGGNKNVGKKEKGPEFPQLKPVVPFKPKPNDDIKNTVNTKTSMATKTPSKTVNFKEDDDEEEGEIYDDAESIPQHPLMKFDWYHGDIGRPETEKRLEKLKSDGSYLIRKSTKDKSQPYTLAVLFEKKISNLPIRQRPDKKYALGKFKENEVLFASVPEIISHHKNHDVLLLGEKTGKVKLKNTPPKN